MALLIETMPVWVSWMYGAVGAVAAMTDYHSGKIYNWLTLPTLVLGLALVAMLLGVGALPAAFAGLGVATALFVPLFFVGVLGGGDVKLLMALGPVLGSKGALELAAASIIIAGFGAFALLIKHKRVKHFFGEFFKFARSLVTPQLEIHWPKLSREIKAPFGVAIFLGLVWVLSGGVR